VPRAKKPSRNSEADAQKALLAAIVESSRDAIVSKDLDGIVTSWNRGAQLVFGYSAEEIIGKSIKTIIPPEKHGEEDNILAKIRMGERIEHYETLRQRKDGTLINVSLTISPIRGRGGRIVGASKIGRDVTERHRAEETRRLLMREVNHRSKNLLAVVEAMVRKTASTTPSAQIVSRISQRLQALSAIQNLLIYGDWRGVDLGALIRAQMRPFPHDNVRLDGPELMLKPPAAQALGLAFHELVTNAIRYGSLSSDAGSVEISWKEIERGGDKWLDLIWKEMDGPRISTPERSSFGTTILQRATAEALEGEVEIDYREGGLNWHVAAPMKSVAA